MNKPILLQHASPKVIHSQARWLPMGIACACLLVLAFSIPLPASEATAAAPAASPKTFNTAKEAADALIQAAEKGDVTALIEIFGPDSKDLLVTGDEVQDKNNLSAFIARAREKNVLEPDPKNKNIVTLSVGNDDWPLPIPIIKQKGKWRFDVSAGRQEILYRRIGGNELDAIQICRGYVEAQHEYAMEKHDGALVNQYAQRIISTPGKQDGLAWQNPDGTWGGPVGENIARAIEEGYSERAKPYHGYYFRVLKGQGPAAPLGELNYVIEGAMIGGFALVAAPAEYRITGVKTFMVSQDGVVYEKDLGPDTLKICKEMQLFNPDSTWHPVLGD